MIREETIKRELKQLVMEYLLVEGYQTTFKQL